MEKGEISEHRIDESLQRVSKAKEKLFKSQESFSFVDISTNDSQQVINEILVKSNQTSVLKPIVGLDKGINLVVVNNLLNCDFLDRQSPSITIPDSFGYHAQVFDQCNLYIWENQLITEPFILQVFVRGNPFRGTAGLSAIALKAYEQILENHHLQGIMVYGSPYVLDWFKNQIPTPIPWGFSYGQMAIAQRTICNKMFQLSTNLDITKGNFL